MARFLHAQDFESRPFNGDALHLYTRAATPRNRSIIVFVHGLGGGGYKTWGTVPPAILGSELASVDVAIFDYLSGLRRRFFESPSIEVTIEQLVDELEPLDYDSVYLVGHSMGGVIAMGAVREAYLRQQTFESPLVRRIRGIFTLASPLAGSKRVPRIFTFMSDLKTLQVHSEKQREVAKFFADQVSVDLTPPDFGRLWIPHFAAKAAGDKVVDPFSSTAHVPSDRSKIFSGSHTSILKNDGITTWLTESILEIEQRWMRKQRTQTKRPRLTASFEGRPSHGEWFDCYQAALRTFNETENSEFSDMTGQAIEAMIDLRVRVLNSEDFDSGSFRYKLNNDVRLQETKRYRAIGISVFDSLPSDLFDESASYIGDHPTRWLTATDSLSALRQEVGLWLKRVNMLAPMALHTPTIALNWAADRPEGEDPSGY